MSAVFEAALAPYRGSPTFNAGPSWTLLRAYADKLKGAGLPLTDAELADGIKKFGAWHVANFGEGVTAWSSPIAVAAQSVEEAVAAKTGAAPYTSQFWAAVAASGDLAKGDQAGMLAGQIAYRSQHSYGEFSGFDNLMQAGIAVGFSAVLGAGIASEFGLSLGADAFGGAVSDGGSFGADALIGAASEPASLGSLGSGTFGVDVAGVGAYGTTEATAGALGTGLADTAVATLGLDVSAVANTAAASLSDAISFDSPAGISGTVEGSTTVDLESSIGNFGDWIGTDSGTMYNPQTGEYLTPDGYYNAGSLGSSAPGGADAYTFSSDFLSSSAATSNSLVNDIFSSPGKFLQSVRSALAGFQGTAQQLQQRPANFTRAAGQTNLALPLLAAAAYFALRG